MISRRSFLGRLSGALAALCLPIPAWDGPETPAEAELAELAELVWEDAFVASMDWPFKITHINLSERTVTIEPPAYQVSADDWFIFIRGE